MIFHCSDLAGWHIKSSDRHRFLLHDILFDSRTGQVHRFVIIRADETGEKFLLIDADKVDSYCESEREIHVCRTAEEFQHALPLEQDPPLDVQEASHLVAYYDWPTYWAVQQKKMSELRIASEEVAGSNWNPWLWSAGSLLGFDVYRQDKHIGQIADLVMDTATRHIITVAVAANQSANFGDLHLRACDLSVPDFVKRFVVANVPGVVVSHQEDCGRKTSLPVVPRESLCQSR
ncbi:MAG: hypothetical protein R3C20_11705 [Planctomycetaceae bacterium]